MVLLSPVFPEREIHNFVCQIALTEKGIDYMIYDLEKVKEMFKVADEIIHENPSLLSMSTDQIFYELDDGTQKMIHARWGVMARAKINELKSFQNQDIIDFLLTIKERNLLSEYIGFVLQSEHNVSLLEILLESYERGVQNQILPFVNACIEYEEDCFSKHIDKLLGVIAATDKVTDVNVFVNGYAALVVSKKEETIFLERYISNYSIELEILVRRIGGEMYRCKSENVEKWLDVFLNEESEHCKLMGIDFLYRSDIMAFDQYFLFVEKEFCDNEELFFKLIPVYVQYLVNQNGTLNRVKVKERLISVKEGSLRQKRECVKSIEYYFQKSQDCIDIMDQITSVSFEKDKQILDGLDYYLEYKFKKDFNKAITILYKIYIINNFKMNESFMELLPQTCSVMKQEKVKWLAFWGNKFLHGNIGEFSLSLDLFEHVFTVEDMPVLMDLNEFTKEELLNLLEGILLFTIEEKKISALTFYVAAYYKDKDSFFEYCIDKIYANYSGALMDEASKYADSTDVYQSDLSNRLIAYNESYKNKIILGYNDKDFMPPTERQRIYRKSRYEQNKKMNEEAHNNSIFAQFFPNRKMKYGNKVAFIQVLRKGELKYVVSEYSRYEISKELPRHFINDPTHYVYMRMEYLRKRCKNEADS